MVKGNAAILVAEDDPAICDLLTDLLEADLACQGEVRTNGKPRLAGYRNGRI
jgi:hypothetical protein